MQHASKLARSGREKGPADEKKTILFLAQSWIGFGLVYSLHKIFILSNV